VNQQGNEHDGCVLCTNTQAQRLARAGIARSIAQRRFFYSHAHSTLIANGKKGNNEDSFNPMLMELLLPTVKKEITSNNSFLKPRPTSSTSTPPDFLPRSKRVSIISVGHEIKNNQIY